MNNNKKGFTLAEVLITLTIIGVVAALTIPSLLANVNDKTYEAKRKGLETRIAQALAQLDVLNSYEAKPPSGYAGALSATEYAEKYSSVNFITEGLSKVYKITNICEFDNYAACDFPQAFGRWWDSNKYYTANYRKFTMSAHKNPMTAQYMGGLATEAAAFRSKNGESGLIWYNPRCIAEQDVPEGGRKLWPKEVCFVIMVDIDGAKKGPNAAGKDIFWGLALYPDTPYFILINPNFLGVGGNKPSYSATGDNIEKLCNNASGHNFAKGSLTLPSREHAYVLRAFYAHGGWTNNVTGSGQDDYGWLLEYGDNGMYTKLAKRTETVADQQCVQKETIR